MSSVLPWERAWPRLMVSAVQALCPDLAQPGQSSVGPALLSQQQRLATPDLAAASGRVAAAAPVRPAVQGWQSPVTGCLGQVQWAALAGWLAAAGLWFPGYCSPWGGCRCLASCWCDPVMQQPASEKPVERYYKWQPWQNGNLDLMVGCPENMVTWSLRPWPCPCSDDSCSGLRQEDSLSALCPVKPLPLPSLCSLLPGPRLALLSWPP